MERNQYSQKVKNILGEKLKQEKIEFKIENRFKHLYSIYKKMQIKDRKFDEIYDVFALRIVVPTISDCYKTLGIVHTLWKPKSDRMKDYIAVPKPNGYRSLHTTVFGPENKATEFQIRTLEMHEESLYGIAAHCYYKEKKGQNLKNNNQPKWIKEILKIQRETKNTNDFIKSVKLNVFQDRIFVFSPKGDVVDLPKFSTPIDYAYAIHTEIGNTATGSLINNKMKTLESWNNTLIIFVADHGVRLPDNIPAYHPDRYHIPMIWTGGVIKKDTVITGYGSQTDIPTSILSQLNLKTDEYKFGKDLFNKQSESFVFYDYIKDCEF